MSPHPNIAPDSTLISREPEAYLSDQSGDPMTKIMDDLLGLLNDTASAIKEFKEARVESNRIAETSY